MSASVIGTRDRTISLDGNTLVLTEDTSLISAQLDGSLEIGAQSLVDLPLMDNISTDEIIPSWCCYWYDEKLGDYAYLGLRGREIKEGSIKSFAPQIIVSGEAKGCGSSREHAVYAEKYAGVQLVFARSFERIYQQNCRNVGVVTCDDFGLLDMLLSGQELPLEVFTRRSNNVERAIVDLGGLFKFNLAYATGTRLPLEFAFSGHRPLNYVEKVIQTHLPETSKCREGETVKVGESYFVDVDTRFSHEYVTAMSVEMFERQFQANAAVADPGSVYFFQDHLSLADTVLEKRRNGPELVERIRILNQRQKEFAAEKKANFVGESNMGGSNAICHNYIVENVARPGDVIIGTDSHTCTSGAVGALAFGVGATDIANAWYTRQILVKVPEVIRINLNGGLRPGVCAKDLMLTLLAHPRVQGRHTLGKVLLYTGPACADINMDERATLCNMAVEAGAMTAIFPPDQVTTDFLTTRDSNPPDPAIGTPNCDENASYAATVEMNVSDVEAMVSLPGDPRNAVPLTSIAKNITVDTVYGGSCTGGKAYDMDMYARVFAAARARGATVADGVRAYIQVGSQTVMRHAVDRGYIRLFQDVGVTVLPPSCGACINAGPGVSERPTQITVSSQNRNFPGRSGPGQVYLASPYVVAATAIAGRLTSVEEMFDHPSVS